MPIEPVCHFLDLSLKHRIGTSHHQFLIPPEPFPSDEGSRLVLEDEDDRTGSSKYAPTRLLRLVPTVSGFLLRRLVATPLFISILCRVGRWRIILSILSSHPRVN